MTCGECAWCWRDEDDYYGDCTAPLPMWVMSDEYNSIHDLLDASSCPCFKARERGSVGCGDCENFERASPYKWGYCVVDLPIWLCHEECGLPSGRRFPADSGDDCQCFRPKEVKE
jgi:hypothetical protein